MSNIEQNVWYTVRKECKLSRENVENMTESKITAKMLENIENEKTPIKPEQVLILSNIYKKPELTFNYCSKLCPVGMEYMPKCEFSLTSTKDLPIITLELLDTLNCLVQQKDRLIGIVADGKIDDEEKVDFEKFYADLEKMELTIKALKAWASKNFE